MQVLTYERHNQELLSKTRFLLRLFQHIGAALLIFGPALLMGVAGYRFLAKLSWIDALLNASMILGGMGPVDTLHSNAAKVFASFYALFAGVVFLVVAGVLIAPMLHRMLHYFHIELAQEKDSRRKK